jgi:hypothetical protein
MRSLSRTALRTERGAFLAVHPIELLQVLSDALFDQLHPQLHLTARKVAVAMVDRFELAAVDRNNGLREHTESATQHDKLAAHAADRRTVLSTKIGQGFEVRSQATCQPHQLQVAIRLLLESATRLDAVQISVQINLQQRPWMVGRTAGCIRLKTVEAQSCEVQLLDERLDDAYRVVLRDVLINALRQQISLVPVGSLNESAHCSPSFSRSLNLNREMLQ